MCSPAPQKCRIALPLRKNDHHERGTDADRLARREARRIDALPVRTRFATDLDLQVHVFPIIEQALPASTSAAVATENLVESILDREILLKQDSLGRSFTKRAENLLHPFDWGQAYA